MGKEGPNLGKEGPKDRLEMVSREPRKEGPKDRLEMSREPTSAKQVLRID